MQEKTKKLIIIAIFVALGFGAMQVPLSTIIGSTLKFNLFDFYGPIVGSFMGSIWGMVLVLIMQAINWGWLCFATDISTLIRFLPIIFAVLYFAKPNKYILIVPATAMIAFWLHPEGRQAWYYALYWLIPIVMYFFHKRWIFARALGTTFTAHAVGSVLFLYTMNLPATVWISLIPVVWKERGIMAIGMALTYILFNFLFSLVVKKYQLKLTFLKVDSQYRY
jgi:hypothetical protein